MDSNSTNDINNDNYSSTIESIGNSQDPTKINRDEDHGWRKYFKGDEPFLVKFRARTSQKEEKLGRPITGEEIEQEARDQIKEELESYKNEGGAFQRNLIQIKRGEFRFNTRLLFSAMERLEETKTPTAIEKRKTEMNKKIRLIENFLRGDDMSDVYCPLKF